MRLNARHSSSPVSETSAMRAGSSSVNRSLIVAEETRKKRDRSRKRETYEKEQEEEEEAERGKGGGGDEETGGRAGRSSGRGRTRRRLVGGRERSRRSCEEEREATLGRSIGVRGGNCCCCCCWRTTSGMRAGKSAMSSFGRAIPVAVAASRGN